MVRIVVDPGVLIAASIAPNGVCGQVLQAVLDERCVLIVSSTLLTELDEVLVRPKFRRYFGTDEARQYVALVASVGERHPDPGALPGISPDPDDDYLIALAQATDVDYLVAGDPHLTGLSDLTPSMLTPRAFLNRLAQTDS